MFGTFAFAQTPFATAEVGIIYASSVLESAQGADVINAFANFNLGKNAVATLGVNNLTNTLGYTESNDGRMAARSINGRSVKAGLKYNF